MEKQWKENKGRFIESLSPIKNVIMKIIFSGKQVEMENLAEALAECALNTNLKPPGMSYVVTKYKKLPINF